MSLRQLFSRQPITSEPAHIQRYSVGAAIESLESRTHLAVDLPIVDGLIGNTKGVPAMINKLAKPAKNTNVDLGQVLNVSIPEVTSLTRGAGGVLTGTADAVLNLADGTTRAVEALITIQPDADEDGCPILNLELQAIDLNLLGLRVQTSDICLNISGQEGQLLGDLLCGLSGLLDGPISGILDRLNDLFPINLGLDLTNFTNNAGQVSGNGLLSLSVAGNSVTQNISLGNLFQEGADGACDILNLEVGPLDLNLLGLVVGLDDCDDGPVTVDVTAVPGAGNLLGNLLCGVTGILDGGLPLNRLNQLLGRLNRLLDRLL